MTETTFSVLFIGNSFTYYNRMYDTFTSLCEAAGMRVVTVQISAGGYTLADFCNSERRECEKLIETLKSRKWDFCVLQEQSFRPAGERKLYFDSLRRLLPFLKGHSEKQFLYQTWGYGEGNPLLTEYGYTSRSMTAALHDSVFAAADTFGCGICPVGDAFLRCGELHPEIGLYESDLSHPSREGSYLTACIHFASLFGVRVGGVNYAGELDNLTAITLRRLADGILSERNEIK